MGPACATSPRNASNFARNCGAACQCFPLPPPVSEHRRPQGTRGQHAPVGVKKTWILLRALSTVTFVNRRTFSASSVRSEREPASSVMEPSRKIAQRGEHAQHGEYAQHGECSPRSTASRPSAQHANTSPRGARSTVVLGVLDVADEVEYLHRVHLRASRRARLICGSCTHKRGRTRGGRAGDLVHDFVVLLVERQRLAHVGGRVKHHRVAVQAREVHALSRRSVRGKTK